jgi:hypothetical protein
MTLYAEGICPECGQVHRVPAVSVYQPKPSIEVCGECVSRRLDAEIEASRAEAYIAAYNLTGGTMKRQIIQEAEMKVLREKLLGGRHRLPEYWRAVRRKIEE